MPYDLLLADRVRQLLTRQKHITEKRMFGCLGFFRHGNIFVGVWKQSLIARLGRDAAEEALKEPDVRSFDITGKPMRNWVTIDPSGVADVLALEDWIRRAMKFVRTLPAK